MSKSKPDKIFDWYQLIIELGQFEVEHGRTRFYETAKIHLAIMGGVLALASYAVANKEPVIFFLGAFAAIFGAINAIAWSRQIISSVTWESRWYISAAKIEETKEFREAVGANEVKVWSHEEVKEKLLPKSKRTGVSPTMYRWFIHSLVIFYIILALLSVYYGLYKIIQEP